jgi:hypothetical protein
VRDALAETDDADAISLHVQHASGWLRIEKGPFFRRLLLGCAIATACGMKSNSSWLHGRVAS